VLKNGPLTIRLVEKYQIIQLHPDWLDFIEKTQDEIKNESNCNIQ
jgi:hypothetical protein